MIITVLENGVLRDATSEDTPEMAAARIARAAEQAEFARLQYQRDRAEKYPDMFDYLDGIVKGDQAQIQAYIDACLAVKVKYPKP